MRHDSNSLTSHFRFVNRFFNGLRDRRKLKAHTVRLVGLLLTLSLLANSAPAAPRILIDVAQSTKAELTLWMQLNDIKPRLMSFVFGDQEKGGKQEKQTERDARVSRLEILPGDVTVQEGQRITFTAVAFDRGNNPVGGVKIRWSGRDEGRARDTFINQRGDFMARAEGNYKVTAEAAGQRAVVNVTVVPGIRKHKGDDVPIEIKTKSSRDLPTYQASDQKNGKRNQVARANARVKGASNKSGQGEFAHTAKTRSGKGGATAAASPYFLDDGWGNDNYWSVDDPVNRRGDPPGSAVDEGAGSSNFRFDAPIAFIPGRGIDIALSLTYNSRLWNKAGNNVNYDIDRDWPAPGFNLGFGKMQALGIYNGSILLDGDGTRHPYTGTITIYNWGTTGVFHTTDGTLVDYQYQTGYNGIMLWGQARYPNGTTVDYWTNGPSGLYPTRITDPNGNYITITYVNNVGPRIQTVTDTMGRFINFHYDTANRLTAITSPGLESGTRTLVRLHYSQLSLNYSFAWPNVGITRESAPWVIDAIYYPGSNTGFWLGLADNSYSTYGMVKKVTQRRGMTFSGPDPVPPGQGTTDQGTITAGTLTNEEVYNYPLNTSDTTGTQASNLNDAPTFTSCTERWTRDGTSTMDQAVTGYEITTNSTQRIVTITEPNGTVTKQYSHNLPGSFLDGLIFLDETKSGSTVLQSSSTTWASGAYDSPRATEVLITNPNNQTTKTTFSYGSYNQVTEVRSFDYGGTSFLTATRTQYQNSTNYTNRHIFNLPLVVEMFASDDTTKVSRTEYQYDGQALTDTPNVVQHDNTWNPHFEPIWIEGDCYLDCSNAPDGGQCDWVCDPSYWYTPYDPATDYRGNVTQFTTYANPVSLTGTVTETRTYDMTGNLVTSSSACCQQTSVGYTVDTQYAYPETLKRGSSTDALRQVTESSTYDFNTGVAKIQNDANNRQTETTRDAVTLRPIRLSMPGGAHTEVSYDDANLSMTQTTYKETHPTHTTIAQQSIQFRNGRNQIRQEKALTEGGVFDIVDTVYNSMGDVAQQSRPYRSGDTIRWSTTTYDALQRIVSLEAPDGNKIESFYNEPSRPSAASSAPGETMRTKDAWGRERWGRSNSLGRLVEVVEPDPNGSGSVATNGMATTYAYDTIGNLTTVTQENQTRSFKHDALGRMTAQKVAERSATLDSSGNYVGVGGSGAQWSDFFRYDSRSNLVQYRDARGVKVNYWYFDRTGYSDPGDVNATRDPLNRLQSITYDTTADPNYSLTPGQTNYYLKVLAAPTVSFQYRAKSSGTERKDVTQPEVITADQTSTESLHYDSLGRVDIRTLTINGRTSFPFVTNYTYDALERTTDVQYPAEYGNGAAAPRRMAHQNFDIASRLSSLTMDGQTHASNVVYNAASQVTSVKIGVSGTNQITENYSYSDTTGLLEGQTITRNGSTLLNLSYDHANSNGKRTGQLVKLLNNLDHTKDRGFEYDAVGRLKKATGGQSINWAQRYIYDRYGNRTNAVSYTIDQYVRNFYQSALNRQPTSTELQTHVSTLQTAYAQGPSQFLTAMRALGTSVFTSSEYNEPDNREFVRDLYRAFLYREPDQSGEDFWTNLVPINGRSNIRLAFEVCPEFASKVEGISPIGHPSGNPVPRDGWEWLNFEATTNRISDAGWTYDTAGNQVRVKTGTTTWQAYQYDAANRLMRVVADDKTTVIASYTYGADRQRLSSHEPAMASGQGLRTYYVEEGGTVSAEYTEVGSSTSPVWSKSYVYFAGRLVSTLTPNSGAALVDYHHPDRLGTRVVSNAQNTNYFEQVALPFGTAFGLESSPSATSRRFTSYDRTESTGLDYASNRFYDPRQGRFSQVDPIAMDSVNLTNPQTLNLYAYCINDPVNLIDPSGLGLLSFLKKIFVRGLKAVIAAAVAFVVTFVQTGSFDRAKAAAKQAFIDNFRQIPRRRIGTPPTFPVGIGRPPLHEIFRGTLLSRLFPAPAELLKWTHISRFQETRNDCLQFANFAERAAKESWTDRGFARRLWGRYAENAPANSPAALEFDDSGWRQQFQGSVSPNQARHFSGIFWNAFTYGQWAFGATIAVNAAAYVPSMALANRVALNRANAREVNDPADVRLNNYAVTLGVRMAYGYTNRFAVAQAIRSLCGSGW